MRKWWQRWPFSQWEINQDASIGQKPHDDRQKGFPLLLVNWTVRSYKTVQRCLRTFHWDKRWRRRMVTLMAQTTIRLRLLCVYKFCVHNF